MTYDNWKTSAPDENERCVGISDGCDCPDCRAMLDEIDTDACRASDVGNVCATHGEQLLCPHVCRDGGCDLGCDEMTDHELRGKAVAR